MTFDVACQGSVAGGATVARPSHVTNLADRGDRAARQRFEERFLGNLQAAANHPTGAAGARSVIPNNHGDALFIEIESQ